jgi:hypothetical protein
MAAVLMQKIARVARHPIIWAKSKWKIIRDPRYCYVCKCKIPAFQPYRGGLPVSDFVADLAMVGSDIVNFSCPYCGCHDRTRHLMMYFDKLNLWDYIRGAAILHIAAETDLAAKIQDLRPSLYVKGDLIPNGPGIEKIDITDIPHADGSFDFIICNHVLEHVPDDRKALSEFHRVLRPGAHAVLQTPFSRLLKYSFCDPAINSDNLRRRFYLQEDHVRLYGMDLFTRIEEAGFKLHTSTHRECLPEFDHRYYGVNPDEDLILVEK